MRVGPYLSAVSLALVLGVAVTGVRGAPAERAAESAAADPRADGQGHPLPPRQGQRPPKASIPRAAGETVLSVRTEFWWSSFGGVCIIVALVLVGARLLRRWTPLAPPPLPREAVQVLGRSPLTAKHMLHLVRCGKSLLVLGTTQDQVTTLARITDPAEVDYVSGACQQSADRSVTATFRQMLQSRADRVAFSEAAGAPSEPIPDETGGATGQIDDDMSQLLENANAWKSQV